MKSSENLVTIFFTIFCLGAVIIFTQTPLCGFNCLDYLRSRVIVSVYVVIMHAPCL
jgi:hypothetical protein